MFKRLQQLFQLPLFIEAWFLFLKLDRLISSSPYAKWKHYLESAINPNMDSVYLSPLQINQIIKVSESASRHRRKMNCLRRCLCQKQLLYKRGVYCQIHFGVIKNQENIKGHCWLSHNGKIINDSKEVVQQYTELEGGGEKAVSYFR